MRLARKEGFRPAALQWQGREAQQHATWWRRSRSGTGLMVRRRSRRYRSSDPQAESVELNIDIAPEADGRADDLALVAPGTAADDTVARIAAEQPRRSVCRRAVVVLVPAILDPLPDIAVHIVKPPRVRLQRSNRRRLLPVPLTAAAVAIGMAHIGIVAPGIAGAGASPGG